MMMAGHGVVAHCLVPTHIMDEGSDDSYDMVVQVLVQVFIASCF
jgi:hypothetical protein